MKEFNELKKFKKLKFHSVVPQDILQAVGLLKKLGYEVVDGFSADYAAKHNGLCAWNDGELTEGWSVNSYFEQVTLEDLKNMVGSEEEVLWLNKFTLEESYLSVGEHWKGIGWVEVPEGATFATGDKDNFVFRKDGWYYDNQTGWWVKEDLNIRELCNQKFMKLFWIKSDVKGNTFTTERLLGCEVEFINPFGVVNNGHIFKVMWDKVVFVCCGYHFEIVHIDDLTFFTEDGDELTFDEYVQLYYPKG